MKVSRTRSSRTSWLRSFLVPLVVAGAISFAAAARAATVPVTVTIASVMNIATTDAWFGAPDFYVRIYVDGTLFRSPTIFDTQGVMAPAGWSFTVPVSRVKRGGLAPVRVELWDFDAPLADALVDIDPASCGNDLLGCAELSVGPQPADSMGIDVNVNLRDGSWTAVNPAGDSNAGPPTGGDPAMTCTSGFQAFAASANVCITIAVGAPSPETLTVSKTGDSNRPFCTPGDCSVREAITLAESGDTVVLPASTAPYLLTLPPQAFEPASIFDPSRPSGSHLRIRQPLLIINGPVGGGTAVIRQTQADSRVFDVYAGAKLVMSRVTVTGGGAGDNSTAFDTHIHGGGIHNHGTIELTHVTITGNRAMSQLVGGGGGIYNAASTEAWLTNVTIADNVSVYGSKGLPLGGGIAGPGIYHLRNTIISNNTVEAGGAPRTSNCGTDPPMNIVDQGGSLQFPGSDCGISITTPSRRGFAARTIWLPRLATTTTNPLSPLDPQRLVYPPVPARAAVDTGTAGCGPTDQSGNPAPFDGNGDGIAHCDVGAIEHRR